MFKDIKNRTLSAAMWCVSECVCVGGGGDMAQIIPGPWILQIVTNSSYCNEIVYVLPHISPYKLWAKIKKKCVVVVYHEISFLKTLEIMVCYGTFNGYHIVQGINMWCINKTLA